MTVAAAIREAARFDSHRYGGRIRPAAGARLL